MGDIVGESDGSLLGEAVGVVDGVVVGESDGNMVGSAVGKRVGKLVGCALGGKVGLGVAQKNVLEDTAKITSFKEATTSKQPSSDGNVRKNPVIINVDATSSNKNSLIIELIDEVTFALFSLDRTGRTTGNASLPLLLQPSSFPVIAYFPLNWGSLWHAEKC